MCQPVKFAELGRTSYLYKAFGVQNPSHHLISNAEKLVKCFPPSEPASGGCPKGTVSSCLKPGLKVSLRFCKLHVSSQSSSCHNCSLASSPSAARQCRTRR